MIPGMSITQEGSKKILTVCVPENENHGRIDLNFEFRPKEDDRLQTLQECLFENFIGFNEQKITSK